MLDIDDSNGNTVVSVEYPRYTRASKVLQDIRNYFTDSTTPVISELTRFRSARERINADAAEQIRKENGQLKEDVSRLREMLKLQRTVTNGTKFTRTSVDAAASAPLPVKTLDFITLM